MGFVCIILLLAISNNRITIGYKMVMLDHLSDLNEVRLLIIKGWCEKITGFYDGSPPSKLLLVFCMPHFHAIKKTLMLNIYLMCSRIVLHLRPCQDLIFYNNLMLGFWGFLKDSLLFLMARSKLPFEVSSFLAGWSVIKLAEFTFIFETFKFVMSNVCILFLII